MNKVFIIIKKNLETLRMIALLDKKKPIQNRGIKTTSVNRSSEQKHF